MDRCELVACDKALLEAVPLAPTARVPSIKYRMRSYNSYPRSLYRPADSSWRNVKLADPVPGLRHEFLPVNGIKLHVVRASAPGTSKPVMLFLHGFPESWSAWSAQIAHFREDYDVVAMDMRGYGQSDKPRGFRSYCYRHLVNDVAAVVRAISPKRPVYLVAHDWGANVAWMFAHRHADMIKKLVILCVPHPRCFLKNADLAQMRRSWYVFAFQMPFVGEAMFSVNNYKAVGDMFLGRASGLVNRENFSREDLARKKQEIATPGARTGMLNYYRALAYPDLEFDRCVDAASRRRRVACRAKLDGASIGTFGWPGTIDLPESSRTGAAMQGSAWLIPATRISASAASDARRAPPLTRLPPHDSTRRAGSRTVDCPTLMMYADRDVALGTELFRGHERLVPGIKTHCLQNCSHWAMQDW